MHVVNMKSYGSKEKLTEVFGDKWTYIGRYNYYYGFKESPLHNPYPIKLGSHRTNIIAFYERYLRNCLNDGDDLITEAIKKLNSDSVLVCYCHPKRCHGNVIEKVWKEFYGTFPK